MHLPLPGGKPVEPNADKGKDRCIDREGPKNVVLLCAQQHVRGSPVFRSKRVSDGSPQTHLARKEVERRGTVRNREATGFELLKQLSTLFEILRILHASPFVAQ